MSKQNKQQTNTTSMETLWKVLRFIGKYRFLLVLSIILAAVSVILQLYVPVLFGNAIDQVVAKREVNFRMMWYYLSRILVMIIVSSVATWIMNIINNRMTSVEFFAAEQKPAAVDVDDDRQDVAVTVCGAKDIQTVRFDPVVQIADVLLFDDAFRERKNFIPGCRLFREIDPLFIEIFYEKLTHLIAKTSDKNLLLF